MIPIATLAITIAAGGEAGAVFRRLSEAICQAAGDLPDRNPTGASAVLTFDNSPSSGSVSVQVSGAGLPTQPVYRV